MGAPAAVAFREFVQKGAENGLANPPTEIGRPANGECAEHWAPVARGRLRIETFRDSLPESL